MVHDPLERVQVFPDGNVTVPGPDAVMVINPVGDSPVTVTVHEEVAPAMMEEGLHRTDVVVEAVTNTVA